MACDCRILGQNPTTAFSRTSSAGRSKCSRSARPCASAGVAKPKAIKDQKNERKDTLLLLESVLPDSEFRDGPGRVRRATAVISEPPPNARGSYRTGAL